jgi:DNA mismatch repair ATPase MutS
MGLPSPAKSACIYPVSSIVSAFATEEDTGLMHGKHGQELQTVQIALKQLNDDGLFLFNEPITGTSPLESYRISREILSILLAQGHRGIWVTHLFRLFDDVESLQKLKLRSYLICMRTRQNHSEEAPFSVLEGRPIQDSGTKWIK